MNRKVVDKMMSDMLDSITAISIANQHTDGSYEAKNLDIEDLAGQLHNQWVVLRCEIDDKPKKNEKERIVEDKEPIHEYFGLSYANYLVVPRVVLQSMPLDWQEQFVKLLDQIPEIIDGDWAAEYGYTVYPVDEEGRSVQDPLSNYERGRRRLPLKNLKK